MVEYLEMPDFDDDFPIIYYYQKGHVLTPPHWHEAIEIIYVQQGTLTIGVDDNILTINPGEVYIINGGQTHHILSSPGGVRLVLLLEASIFQTPNIREIIKIFKDKENNSRYWSEDIQIKIKDLLNKIHLELESKNIAYKHQVRSYLHQFLVHLIRNVPDRIKDLNSEGIKSNNTEIIETLNTVYDYIEKNYKKEINLKNIADQVGYTPSYFARYFKKNTGQNFITFLNEYRIQKSKWLLSTTNYPIADVGLQSGFQSRKNFHYVFKENVEMTPLEYRNEIKLKIAE